MGAKLSKSNMMEEILRKKSKDDDQQKQKENQIRVSLDDFEMIQTVGKGSFAKVILVRKKDTNQVYAMKVLKKDFIIQRNQIEHTLVERKVVEDTQHPFIVNLKFAFQSKTRLYMVFDFFSGGEMFHYLAHGIFTEDRARFYAAEIVLALEYLHSKSIIYRDLKPENVLLDKEGHVCLTDFGLSKFNIDGDTANSFVGTPEYLAPEVISRKRYGKAVDWWALGLLIYEMINGMTPFYHQHRKVMYKKILQLPIICPTKMSPSAKDICLSLLQKEPEKRLGYSGPQEVKNHPFFKTINWDEVLAKRIEPTFKPIVKSDSDTRNIDDLLTVIPACESPSSYDDKLLDREQPEHAFRSFSFARHSLIANNLII